MNVFCHCLSNTSFKKFKIEVDVFISEKMRLIRIAFEKPLISDLFSMS